MIKKAIISILVLFLLVMAGSAAFVYFNKDGLIHEVQQQLKNKGINIQMTEVDVGILQTFPYVSVVLTNASLGNMDRSPLIEAEELSSSFELLKLWNNEVDLRKIKLTNGSIHLIRDANGLTNFDFQSNKNKDNKASKISLEEISLENMSFTYDDKRNRHFIRLKNIESDIHPQFEGEQLALNLELNTDGELISLDQFTYLTNQKIKLESSLKLIGDNLTFEHSSKLKIDGTDFNFQGNFNGLSSAAPSIDLQFEDVEDNFEHLSEILPNTWLQPITEYNVKGSFTIDGSIKGSLAKRKTPLITLNGKINDCSFQQETIKKRVQKARGDFRFIYGGGQSGFVELNDIRGQYEGEDIGFNFNLTSFVQPSIQADISGLFHLEDLSNQIIPSILVGDVGTVGLDQFHIQYEKSTLGYQGTLHTEGIQGLLSGIGFTIDEGDLYATNTTIELKPSRIEVLGKEHLIDGTFDLEDEDYKINLVSEDIDLEQFFDALSESQNLARPVNSVSTSNPTVNVRVNSKALVYDHIQFDQTLANIHWKGNKIKVEGELAYCEGAIDGTFDYNLKSGKARVLAESHKINLKEVFDQWNNFGQEQVKAEHLVGQGDIQCLVSFNYQPGKPWNKKSLDVVGGLHIDNGRLIDLPLLKQFSKYINVRDLSNIKFTTLSNVFKISKGRFYLPQMFIQSNAGNLIFAGHQTLDHKINYGLKINAGQVLTKKFKKHNTKLKPVRAKQDGFFNLYYVLEGPISNFAYKANKRRVEDKFEQSLFLRDEILQQLSSNFELDDRYDSPLLFQDIPEVIEETDDEPVYLEGFD